METLDINGIAALLHVTPRAAENVVKGAAFPVALRPTQKRIWVRSEIEDFLLKQREDRTLIGDLRGEPEVDSREDNMLLAGLSVDCGHERAAEIVIDESQFDGCETLADLKRRQAEARG